MLPDLFEGVDPVAQSVIRGYCGWHIAPAVTETVTVDGSGGTIQSLPTLHLTALTITNDGRPVADPEWSEVGVVRGNWTSKFRGVEATMTHGYEECPAEVRAVAARLVAAEKMAAAGGGSVRVGQVQVTAAKAATSRLDTTGDSYCDAILDRYKLPPRP